MTMLVIRNEQLKALFFGMAGPFRRLATAKMNADHPESCARLGPDGVAAAIDLALEKAWTYGFEEDEDILLYLDVMFRVGFRFDEDPKHAWAREILRDARYAPETRVDLVSMRFTAPLVPRRS
jgi:hypothetical protein